MNRREREREREDLHRTKKLYETSKQKKIERK